MKGGVNGLGEHLQAWVGGSPAFLYVGLAV